MKNHTYVLDKLNSFPTAKELLPFQRLTYEELTELSKAPPIQTDFLKGFQEACRSNEWMAASIVTEKYKRKISIDRQDLIRYITGWSIQRETHGKKNHLDILTQECSRYIKKDI